MRKAMVLLLLVMGVLLMVNGVAAADPGGGIQPLSTKRVGLMWPGGGIQPF